MNQKSTVLIVDDQEAMRDALEGMLTNQGYELAIATNGQEAIDLARQLLPDIILLDVMMPDMDGFETCQHLRADPILAKVPIIMVTALNDQDSRLRGIEAGADDFISKSYSKLELRAKVRMITKINRYQRLLNEQLKFKWMFENTDEAYLALNHDKQITYANSKARLYLNLPPTEAPINESFIKLISKHYHQVHEPSKTPVPIDEKLIQLPRYIVRPDTQTALPIWLRVDLMEISGESEEKSLVHLCNVTNTILAKRINWTLAGQISHKLKTPLLPILSGIEFLIKNHSKLPTDKLEEFLKMTYTGGTRLCALVDKILDYANVSNINKDTQDPCTLTNLLSTITTVKEMLDIESLLMLQQDHIENPDKFLIPISCTRIEMVLTELFSNAKNFHPTNTPIIEVDIEAKPDNLCLKIRDNGIQLSPEQLANIWIPYYQGEKYFTGEAEGMGLGMSMVGTLVWEVGGTCQAYNRTDGKGVVIELNFPLKTWD